ncbi:MAG: cytochrome b5-like heme/steroid binding domain-containing protein [Patescibacteria group bacterium]
MHTIVTIILGIIVILGAGGLAYYEKRANEAVMQIPAASSAGEQANSATSAPRAAADDDDDEIEIEDEDDATVSSQSGLPGQGSSGAGAAGGGALASVQAGAITAAEVARHSTRASCWSSINGNVYDLTSWIPKHPGGEQAILQLCGTDGSAKFNKQHGGAAKQAAVLTGFKIGVLMQVQ